MTGHEVAGRGAWAWPSAVPAARFVGRERELTRLTRALATSPAVVLIEGEAGIGKSRLLAESLRGADGLRAGTLVACCPPFREPHTLGPVTDALRQATDGVAGLTLTGLAGALRPLFPEWAASLPPAPEPVEDATADRHRLFRALHELMRALSVALVIVEDAHWADEATLEFLLYLGYRRPTGAGLVVTYRPDDVLPGSLLPRLSRLAGGAGGLHLTLGPLDLSDTGALVSSMLAGAEPPDGFAAFVHERTEGVPLAVEEYVRLLADRYDLSGYDSGWGERVLAGIAVPPTVRDTVLERAAQLGTDAQAMLRAAAVLAEEADEALLAEVSALPPGSAANGLAEALRSGLLGESRRGLLSFRHALAAQAVYQAMPGADRRALHLRSGHALENRLPIPVPRLARHFREAGETAAWLRYAERAAGQALASGDEDTAVDVIRDLIDNARPPDCRRVAALLNKITFASVADPACCRDVERSLRALLDSGIGEAGERAQVRFHLGRVLGVMEDHEGSRAELERAIPDLAGHPSQAARAMTKLGWPHDATSTTSAHLRWLRRGARTAASLDTAERLSLLEERATALLLLGQEEGWTAAAELADEAAAAPDPRQITLVNLNSGDTAMTWGRYRDASRKLARAMELANVHHYRRYHEAILGTQAHLDWFTGRWEGLAERVAELGQHEFRMVARLEAILVTALLHTAKGASGKAEELLADLLAIRRRQGAPYFVMEPAAALARVLLSDGRLEAALAVTDEPSAVVAAKRTWVWACDLAPVRVAALAAAGRTGEAADLIAAFGRAMRGRQAPAPQAALVLCRAVLAAAQGQHSRAVELYGRAAAAWHALPRPYDALLAREQLAAHLAATGDEAGCDEMLTDVFRGLARLGATGDTARVGRALRERGVTAFGASRGRPGYGAQLSPRELDVSRLVVAGGTNKEIGGKLSLSPKTVARHLDSAMHKLGVSSRTALAVRLVEQGMVTRDLAGHPEGAGQLADPRR